MPKAKEPDFLIVGLEKSGTHWVSGLLNAHPEVACIPFKALFGWQEKYQQEFFGEVHLFNTLGSLEPGNEEKFSRPLSNFLERNNKFFAEQAALEGKIPKAELYKKFIERYNELCDMHRRGKKLVGESTPAYIFYLDFIDSFYPGIKKLCIIRDPKDRVVSWNFNQIRKGRKKEMEISDEFALEYCRTRIMKEYEAMLAYQGHIHCLTYESLSIAPQEAVKGILEYLGTDSSLPLIDRMVAEAAFEKVSNQDNNQEGRKKGEELIMSHYRKGIAGDWKNYLTGKQAELIDNLVGELQQQVFNKYKVITYK